MNPNKKLVLGRAFWTTLATIKNYPFPMKTCTECQGSGNHFHMRDGKPTWEVCTSCNGKGIN